MKKLFELFMSFEGEENAHVAEAMEDVKTVEEGFKVLEAKGWTISPITANAIRAKEATFKEDVAAAELKAKKEAEKKLKIKTAAEVKEAAVAVEEAKNGKASSTLKIEDGDDRFD